MTTKIQVTLQKKATLMSIELPDTVKTYQEDTGTFGTKKWSELGQSAVDALAEQMLKDLYSKAGLPSSWFNFR